MSYWDYDSSLPLPSGMLRQFERREHIFNLGLDYVQPDNWTQTIAVGGTITRPTPATSMSESHLLLTTNAAADQAAIQHVQKFIQMPGASPGAGLELFQFLLFEAFVPNTSQYLGVGMNSGTATEFLSTAGAPLTAGAGLMWYRATGAVGWSLRYKTAAGAIQTLYTASGTTVSATHLIRLGWMLRYPRTNGRILLYPICQVTAGPGGAPPEPDSAVTPQPLRVDDFVPSVAGLSLDPADANFGDASESQCAIAASNVGSTAAARSLGITRILYADNYRR